MTGRSAAHAALLLASAVLLSLLLPIGAARASAPAVTGTAAADGACASLALAPFGDPGAAVGKATITGDGTACFTFTAEQPGLHRVVQSGNETYAEVFDGGTALDCYDPDWGPGWCDLPHAGTYTLKITNTQVDPREAEVTVTPLATTANCEPETGTSWDEAPVAGSAAGPLAVQCHPFTGKAGERVTADLRTTVYGDSVSWITDETGAHICPHFNDDDSKGCVLPGDGPYRVLTQVTYAEKGFPAEYTLTIRRLSDPAGCASVPLNAYNSAPTTVDPASGCKTFTAPAAGHYSVYEVESGARSPLAVYDRSGKTVCASGESCDLAAAGDYIVYTDNPTLVLDRTSTTGCEPVELGLHQGTFAVAGEVDCLTLPFPAGARTAVLTALNGPEPRPDVVVADADGNQRCDWNTLGSGTCELTGRAPFHAWVSTDDTDPATGSYSLALYRTDAATNCPAVPAGDFSSTSASARFSTGDGVFSRCLSIPADDHSAMENLQLQAVTGTSTAQFSVLDANGKQVCSVTSSLSTWTTCALAPGVAHTVLVTGRDTPASYTLTRRDVTASAKGCTANPATAVGGPSTGGTLGAPGALVCRQVTTAEATDTLHLNVRDALGTANILAYGADGGAAETCGYVNRACAVTGSTTYQVVLSVPTRLKSAGAYRFDALRIATAAGPAAECDQVPNASYGYGPVTGTLDEQHSAVCAALPTAYDDRFSLAISDTAGGAGTAVPALYNKGLANGCMLYTPSGYECSVNGEYGTNASPSILVLDLPEKASATSYSAELVCDSPLCGPEKISVGSVTPTAAPAGARATVQVTGTALHKDDKVRLYLAGKAIESTTTSVSADRKTLTAVLDLTGAAAGTWSLSVLTHNGWEHGQGSFTVSPALLKNTAAPTISGSALVDDRITATTGAWSPAPASYTYQWKADGKAILKATAAAYTVPAAYLGKKLTVTVTAHRTDTPDVATTSAAVTVAMGAAPRATTAPKITSAAKVGAKLSVAPGVWAPAATTYTYQWKADGKAIPKATAAAYTVPAACLGKKLTVTVTAHRTGHTNGAAATTAAVKVAVGSAPKTTEAPTVSGTAKVGRTLRAAHGTWSPAPNSYAYQWYANGKAIKGATKSSLTLKSAQRSMKITVRVTARRTGHTSGTATSRPTAAVAR